MNAHQRVPSFNEKVAEFLKTVSYRAARTPEERDAIFALRYRGYLLGGSIAPNETCRFSDPWDDVDNVFNLGMYVDGRLTSAVRVHVNRPVGARIPAMEPFGDVIEPFVATGKVIVDPSRFVIDPEMARIGPELPFLTLRMIAMTAEHFGAEFILAAIRQEHLVMYRRVVGHRPISEPRSYPRLAGTMVCTLADIGTLRATAYGRHPFLDSTPAEREALFGPCPW